MPGAGNPQAFNRYAYGWNNPVKYNDPSGHCPFAGDNRDVVDDCTLEQFEAASWDERLDWVKSFTALTGKGKWFDDVRGVIADVFKANGNAGFDTWAKKADAGILQALQNGWRRFADNDKTTYTGLLENAVGTWKVFFQRSSEDSGASLADIKNSRYDAEQLGADYGWQLGGDLYNSLPSWTRSNIDTFKAGGDFYRTYTRDISDPRDSWNTLGGLSKLTGLGALTVEFFINTNSIDPVCSQPAANVPARCQ